MNVRIGAKTDKGMKRLHNEDSLYCNKEMGLFVLADGMGGHRAGDVASRIAVETVADNFKTNKLRKDHYVLEKYNKEFSKETNRLASAIGLASCKIYESAAKSPECHGMGTTIVSVLLSNNMMSMACVGDSRLYLIRNGVIRQLSNDHSLVNEQLKSGLITEKESRNSRLRNVITRALGTDKSIEVDLDEEMILSEDQILMCSDGLHDMLEDSEILDAVLNCSGKPQKACDSLIKLANEKGGSDNISVILLHISEDKNG
ncbi:MAG: Stp1/IreP family PP2C-type Ser/Thr phosphatase [Deltaproteobacteria bacterium]|nr:Stp1/IreP family PP2C-type Ser/Thr phosphatase [Deltaproteobacteria bacterium]